jgi:hypothetical protein
MKKSITDNINDSKLLSEIDKNIAKLIKIKDLEIKTLEAFKVNLINRRREILNMEVKAINLNQFLENTKMIFDILRKEAKETNFWLELVIEANPDFKERIVNLLKESIELKKILSSIIQKNENKK